MIKEIILIHEGKFHGPEISAYEVYFGNRYDVRVSNYGEFRQQDDYSQSALWYITGFYPKKVAAAFIIHDYRSLSIGKLRWFKDKLKRYANHRPDLRLFHDAHTKEQLGFHDSVPQEILWLGVPEVTKDYRATLDRYAYDFCYIGSMSSERNLAAMIHSFLKAYGSRKTLLLIGKVQRGLDEDFKAFSNIIFKGRLPQEEVFSLVQQSEFAVCSFPYHAPHCDQIPIKLLEYAALGKKIVANDAPSNVRESKSFKIDATIVGDIESMFPAEDALKDVQDNSDFDATKLYWKNRIKASGVERYLASVP